MVRPTRAVHKFRSREGQEGSPGSVGQFFHFELALQRRADGGDDSVKGWEKRSSSSEVKTSGVSLSETPVSGAV